MSRSRAVQDPLLQPLKLKHLVLKNRVMSTSHASGLEVDGFPQERYQRYHEEKAKGGIALTMFGGSSNVAPDSPNIFRQLNVGIDEIIPHLARFSERIHAHGAALDVSDHASRPARGALCLELAADHRALADPRDAAPQLPEGDGRSRHPARRQRLWCGGSALQARAASTASRCWPAGISIGQFLSPKTNRRTDAFGGSRENRCRFGLMVFDEIRRRVGDDFLVGFRFVVDEGDDSGLTFEECVAIAEIFERSGAVDFFNAIYGRMDTEASLALHNMPGMASPIAPWLQRVGEFKRAMTLPVFHAARISDIATARHAIREGLLDMVAMTRAHIADPHIVAKLAAGLEHTIRPCVGATHCQSQYRPSCLHNPSSGRETTLGHGVALAEGPARKVVVVGGGPAGLEAARVCAERGHEVVLFEAADRLGGQVLIAARASWRRDLVGIVDWRAQELRRLGVEVRLNALVEEADVLAENPDLVILATGGTPDIDWIPGAEHCTSIWDALTGHARLGAEIIVYDGTGRHPAPQVAELAAAEGRQVSIVSIDVQLAQELTYAERAIWKKRIYELGLPALFDHQIEQVERRGNRIAATFRNLLTGATIERAADQIIVEHGTIPADGLYHELRSRAANDGVTDLDALLAMQPQPRDARRDGGFELHRIGDAVASRNIHAAVLDAFRLCAAA